MKKMIVWIIIVFLIFTLNFYLLGQLFVSTESGRFLGFHISSPFFFILIPLMPIFYIIEISFISKRLNLTKYQNIVFWIFAIIVDPLFLYVLGLLQLNLFDKR